MRRRLPVAASYSTLALGQTVVRIRGPRGDYHEAITVRHQIRNDGSTVVIELTEVGRQQDELLAAFAECQSGRCSCPTDEYQKVASMEVQPGAERVTLRLQPKPNIAFDSSQIAACLDHTVGKVTAGD